MTWSHRLYPAPDMTLRVVLLAAAPPQYSPQISLTSSLSVPPRDCRMWQACSHVTAISPSSPSVPGSTSICRRKHGSLLKDYVTLHRAHNRFTWTSAFWVISVFAWHLGYANCLLSPVWAPIPFSSKHLTRVFALKTHFAFSAVKMLRKSRWFT